MSNEVEIENPAPIVLFVYNRPWHTRQTVESLQQNELAPESDLYIYSDAAKDEDSEENVAEVRKYIAAITGFNKIQIIEREQNWGLAANIIDGVTEIVNTYGKIIVLEDDLVTSPYFLKFMNEALDFYQDIKDVWHISGWNYPIDTDGLEDTFLWRVMNCWGWATWADRWQYFEKDSDKLLSEFSKKDIKRFNLEGYENFWGQVLANKKGRINTWAIYWYATIFKNNGLCLNPTKTFVSNIGLDGSGLHCGVKNDNAFNEFDLSKNISLNFPENLTENNAIVKRIQLHMKKQKKNLFIRAVNKVSRIITGKNIIK